MENTDILVAGGGAAGIMAALTATENGKGKIFIIEKMGQLGKKILATGNGKCNYTNYYQAKECYRGNDVSFAWKALQKFGYKETISLFKSYGIIPYDRDGYVYPLPGQASCVRDILERELKSTKVVINKEEKITDVSIHRKNGRQDGFIVVTGNNKYFTQKLIIATGGKAGAVHGSDGSGYSLAKSLGHSVITPFAALTSCIICGKYTKDWAGVRTKGTVRAYNSKGKLLCENTGELQFVAQGISGIPVFQVSRYISEEIVKGRKPYLTIDIMPLYSEEEIIASLLCRKKKNGSIGDIFTGMLHNKLAAALLKFCDISIKRQAAGLTKDEASHIAAVMKNWRLEVKDTGGFEKAQVTGGGIPASEINAETMESKICPGLYFAGEVIDVDGICGGYNLQWAWTSGYIAGNAAGRCYK
ncbi:MAG: aminoacetone oxidase family FAD-binding enzyme [Lachnospiraceae bacterium]|jgi:flavoprotein, HI0933 family|nr:aminoacetone oxidase family FAD-binding enzyme [Lachnospiraceae bacterium]